MVGDVAKYKSKVQTKDMIEKDDDNTTAMCFFDNSLTYSNSTIPRVVCMQFGKDAPFGMERLIAFAFDRDLLELVVSSRRNLATLANSELLSRVFCGRPFFCNRASVCGIMRSFFAGF